MRGNSLHNYLVFEVENILRNEGFETFQEHPENLPEGGIDFIDLLVQKEGLHICVEVETTPRYVLTNVAKSHLLELPLLIVVPNRKVQKAVQTRLVSNDLRPGGCDIYILLLSQLKQELTNCFPLFSVANAKGKTEK